MNPDAGSPHVALSGPGTGRAFVDHSEHQIDLAPVNYRQESLDAMRKTIDFTGHGHIRRKLFA